MCQKCTIRPILQFQLEYSIARNAQVFEKLYYDPFMFVRIDSEDVVTINDRATKVEERIPALSSGDVNDTDCRVRAASVDASGS